jgi:biopolymer transport protein TolR
MLRRRLRKRMISSPEVSLTPLIDTALVLLVIFMVATPIIHNSIKIDLPQGKVQEVKNKPENVTIFIDKNNKIYLNDREININDIENNLQTKVKDTKNSSVFVNADKNIYYGFLISVVDKIKLVPGVENVILSTQKE